MTEHDGKPADEAGEDEQEQDERGEDESSGGVDLSDLASLTGLAESGGFGILGGIGELISEARQQLERASYEAGSETVTGRAGGGSVEIQLTGNLEAVSVSISPEIVDPDDVSLLEDLVLAALRHALVEVTEIREQAASGMLSPGGFAGIPGLGSLPALGNLDLGGIDIGAVMGSIFGNQTGQEGQNLEDTAPESADRPAAGDDQSSDPSGHEH
jgi:DNA-binding YbaB/EbfC family protein